MRYRLVFLFLLISIYTGAQQFGAFPPNLAWKQINTDTARIIFTGPAAQQAQRIAAIVHKMAAEQPATLGNDFRKVNIVLHNNTTLANGYVALAPFRSEFYLVPGTNLFEFGNTPWYEQLAIHEYRHVQQYNNLNRGLTRVFRTLLGEEGQALANSITIPAWFFEGDAVYTETALTPQGRGRVPLFLSGYNSLWKEGKAYSLLKLLNGSIKDYVPNHYQLGYLLVNYGYLKYGNNFWREVIKDAASFKGVFYPWKSAIKKRTGLPYRQFVDAALTYYKKEIKEEKVPLPSESETISNYYFPQWIGADSLLYLKSTYKKLPRFYIRTKAGGQPLKLKNIGAEEWFSYRNGIVAYTAYATDARWQLKDYNNIILLNIKTGEEKELTQKSKYFTPDISPSGKTIAAVHINEAIETEIQLLETATGRVLKKFTVPQNTYALHPKFIDEDNIILFNRLPDGSMKLTRMNLDNGTTDDLLSAYFNTIGYPSVQGDTLYFTGSFMANDDLYALLLSSGKLFQLTEGQTDNYYASVYADSIAWSQFTARGLQLKKASLKNLLWKEVERSTLQRPAFLYNVANDTANVLHVADRSFAVRDYKTSYRLFNFHSWRPYYEDPEFTFSLYGQNILNTFTSQLYYKYNQNENSHGGGFNLAYGGWYPVISTGLEYTYNRHIRSNTQQFTLNGLEWRTGLNVPLNFTSGNFYRYFNAGTNYVLSRQVLTSGARNLPQYFNQDYLYHFISWTQQLPRAVQHINPHFGYTVSAEQRHLINEKGYQFNGGARLFLPSFFTNHSLVLTGAYQQRDTSTITFSNRFANSRGYRDYNLSKMWRASVNYHFPLFYPDWGFAHIIYFLRVRPNLFYDYSKVYSKDKTIAINQRSTGVEVYFDTKFWNQLPVSFGVRYSRLLDGQLAGNTNANVWEIILPVNLIPQ